MTPQNHLREHGTGHSHDDHHDGGHGDDAHDHRAGLGDAIAPVFPQCDSYTTTAFMTATSLCALFTI